VHAVINNESQARECLNVTDTTIKPPYPIILGAIMEDNFICKDKPLLYSFSCTLYGYDLIWHFGNETLTTFQSGDEDHLRIFSYPPSAPIYNISTVLTQVSTETVNKYNAPVCVSVLIVQPFNESEVQFSPFTVSCQTHCEDANRTAICQTKHYEVAGMLNKNLIHQLPCGKLLFDFRLAISSLIHVAPNPSNFSYILIATGLIENRQAP
jgi:hypothetical protein